MAIGNFDGAHLGHAALVQAGRALAGERAPGRPVECVALTFDPHPRALFQPGQPLFRLTAPEDRAAALSGIGFDAAAIIAFDRAFASLSAEAFIADILLGVLRADAVVVGEDFHFGQGRKGTPALLVAEGERLGFAVRLVGPVRLTDGTIISSTAIREALATGDIPRANAMLGRPYALAGEVIHGAKRGREIGYRTANLALDPGNALAYGIYAVAAELDGEALRGVASFGRRPHFDNGPPLLEVHLFDFSREIYGQTLRVAFRARLRGEAKFDSLEALLAQMALDCAEARAILDAASGVLPQSGKA
ncbi:MAG: bifunctional riboflavin kinase/FAD synthetase [Beijerinckiaceae bacterium]|nr:bifunctional riboflavin kinase/FAD synthetase [Beijerinckiaceae bacterium]MCZ8299386.1 bifunctional riboflavin kinase/FAD synthetase [Beijerinckiaceae bacterium]